jgi:L-lysine exporter family protein LysE/ArgO
MGERWSGGLVVRGQGVSATVAAEARIASCCGGPKPDGRRAELNTYLGGVLLGLAMITPIGPQNIFLINQGFALGMPRVLVAVVAAGICDTVLIALGGLGTATALGRVTELKTLLLICGAIFLTYLAIQSFRSDPEEIARADGEGVRWRRVVAQCASASVLNPHSVLDVVGVLGVAIAAQAPTHRPIFAAGTISASWLWFIVLALGASTVRRWLTPKRRQLIDRASGLLLLGFAVVFVVEALHN